MIDCTEQRGWVTDVVAQKEHVSLPEHHAPGGVGLHHPGRVPDGVAHPLVSHQALTDVAVEICLCVVLKIDNILNYPVFYIYDRLFDHISFRVDWDT